MNRGARVVLLSIAAMALAAAVFLPPIVVLQDVTRVIAIIDITQSMYVTDMRDGERALSRLDFAKQALIRAVTRLPCGAQLGLGVFTEYRVFITALPVEVCANRHELEQNIDSINPQMAWASSSQIAKGLYLTERMLAGAANPSAIAFLTDGHEAPPINPHYRLEFDANTRTLKGALLGIGGDVPQPIPRFDPEGNPAGVWAADQVMQIDPYSQGRQGSVANEAMEETIPQGEVPPALRRLPGQEHLSALHEPYLALLASETGLSYVRAQTLKDVGVAFKRPEFQWRETLPTDFRWIAGCVALLALTARYAAPAAASRRAARR